MTYLCCCCRAAAYAVALPLASSSCLLNATNKRKSLTRKSGYLVRRTTLNSESNSSVTGFGIKLISKGKGFNTYFTKQGGCLSLVLRLSTTYFHFMYYHFDSSNII